MKTLIPLLRLFAFALPFIVAWVISPTGFPMSISKIGAGEAEISDWIKLGALAVLGFVFSRIPRKAD